MSNVYQEKPNIVTVQISDDTGTAERFVVGKSLDEVIALIEPTAPCAGPGKKPKKDRKPRRTKAEIAAELKFKQQQEREDRESLAGATPQTTGKSAGEAAMDRLKKDAAGPAETVWP
jgi:hypothetical protein